MKNLNLIASKYKKIRCKQIRKLILHKQIQTMRKAYYKLKINFQSVNNKY